MIKATFLLLMFSLTAGAALGQAHIVKQRARELSEQNNARQGITPATPGAPAGSAPAVQPSRPPSPMVASPEVLRQYDIDTLMADVAGIKTGAALEPGQTEELTKHLTTASRGAGKPSAKAVEQLSRSLGAALVQARLTEANHAQMASDMVGILNSGALAPADTEAMIISVQATLQRGGVERKRAVAVANDLKLIASEVQKAAGAR